MKLLQLRVVGKSLGKKDDIGSPSMLKLQILTIPTLSSWKIGTKRWSAFSDLIME